MDYKSRNDTIGLERRIFQARYHRHHMDVGIFYCPYIPLYATASHNSKILAKKIYSIKSKRGNRKNKYRRK